MEKKLTIDELLSLQSKTINQCTIEQVENDNKLVKLTPWIKDQGCMCHYALNIPKAFIGSVTATGEIHYCCNKKLQVVEVDFTKDAKLSVQDLLKTLLSNIKEKHSHYNRNDARRQDDFFFDNTRQIIGDNTFSCPQGQTEVRCGSHIYCVYNPGRVSCCGDNLCGEGQFCSICNGVPYCHSEIGSYCCGSNLCNPRQICDQGQCRYPKTTTPTLPSRG